MRELVLTQGALPKVRQTLIEGMKVSSTASRKATYYHTGDEQVGSVRNLITAMYDLGKELPLVIAAQPSSSGFFIQEAILNELQMTTKRGGTCVINPLDWDDERLRDKAIMTCLDNLETNGTPYVLRMFMEAKRRKINNARARRMMLKYILSHPNLEYMSVKYRGKLRQILQHAWGKKYTRIVQDVVTEPEDWSGERAEWFKKLVEPYVSNLSREGVMITLSYILVGEHIDESNLWWSESTQSYPTISATLKARTDIFQPNVPLEVLIGIISRPTHPQYQELWSTTEKRKETIKKLMELNVTVTETQKMRQTKRREELKVEQKADASKVTDPLVLLKTLYEHENDTTLGEKEEEIIVQLGNLAKSHKIDLPYKHIGIVLDNSLSMRGHRGESKNTPRAIAEFAEMVLSESCNGNVNGSPTNFYNKGATGLAKAFLDVVGRFEKKPEAVFIISDGYENDADGMLEQVMDAYTEMEGFIPTFHLSPIGSAEYGGAIRPLGSKIVSLPADYKGLASGIASCLLSADPARWLLDQFKKIEERAIK